MRHAGVDFVASTEHSYKKPLEAYLWLSDISHDLRTEIIPGVEGVSSEGIDVIFLYRTGGDLRRALKDVQTFRWSACDVARIAEDTGAITIVPHPFHIGKSSAGNVLSRRNYLRLLKMCDYVEIHNGSALAVERRLSKSRVRRLFKEARLKLDKTLNLPPEDRGEGLGWAISSDAHYPGEQYVVGKTDMDLAPDEDVYDFLKGRIRFDYQSVFELCDGSIRSNTKLLRSFQGVVKEGLIKEYLRTVCRARLLVVLGMYYGIFPTS
ncbi:MAG: hypothetical protein H0S80_12835 [Desulfovibrionaceae bacterium]|nr:hypothetical protein [Desulfovibrionaceae bacterium]